MKNRYLLACMMLVLATVAVTVLAYGHLPAQVPTHWDLHGQVTEVRARAFVFLLPAVMLALTALWRVLAAVSPRHFTVDSFSGTWWFMALAVDALLAWIQCTLLWNVLGGGIDLPRAMLGGVAVFTALMGNVLGKVRRNFWLGIRTPWTLASERVWYATHRLAAKALVATGLLALAAVAAGLPLPVAVALVAAGLLVPAIWSLVYYKRIERDGTLGA